MKHKQPKVIPAHTIEYVHKVTCDFCQQEIKKTQYEVDEVTINWRVGSSYPSGGNGENVSVDMCGLCFETKFKEWLKSQNVKPETTEWEH